MNTLAAGDWSGVAAAVVAGFFGWMTVRAQAAERHKEELDELERRYSIALMAIKTYQVMHPDSDVPINPDIAKDM